MDGSKLGRIAIIEKILDILRPSIYPCGLSGWRRGIGTGQRRGWQLDVSRQQENQMSEIPKEFYNKEYWTSRSKGAYADYMNDNDNAKVLPPIRADILREVFEPKSTYELGCAAGFVVDHLCKQGVDAHGVDVSEYIVGESKNPNIVCGDAVAIRIPKTSLVYSFDFMEHLSMQQISEMVTNIVESDSDYFFHNIAVSFKEYGDVRRIEGMDKSHISMHVPGWWVKKFMEIDGLNRYYIYSMSPRFYMDLGGKFFGSMLLVGVRNRIDASGIKIAKLQKLL